MPNRYCLAIVPMLLGLTILCATPVMAAPATNSCDPSLGKPDVWIDACKTAAKAGDARAAILVGSVYWNGDTVPKDNQEAARWWLIADQLGSPKAAKRLGDEAFVRADASLHAPQIDMTAFNEALSWYQKALTVEPDPQLRAQAQQRMILIEKVLATYPGHLSL